MKSPSEALKGCTPVGWLLTESRPYLKSLQKKNCERHRGKPQPLPNHYKIMYKFSNLASLSNILFRIRDLEKKGDRSVTVSWENLVCGPVCLGRKQAGYLKQILASVKRNHEFSLGLPVHLRTAYGQCQGAIVKNDQREEGTNEHGERSRERG